MVYCVLEGAVIDLNSIHFFLFSMYRLMVCWMLDAHAQTLRNKEHGSDQALLPNTISADH